jgi:serine/threonine-protein kinase
VSNILSCPACGAIILPQEAGDSCPKCRTPLPQSAIVTVMPHDLPGMDDATRLAPESKPDAPPGSPASSSKGSTSRDTRPTSSSGWLSSSGAIDHGRFEPGTLLGGRYRIIQRLGRGGMGEVYRADDLKLGQPVALKFLPPDVDRDPARLTQLHTEVRMARQVSHPNVCRVYDIDEVEGATFLSMEYVDGEDLASLLKRVGRFPEDRALEIARQICAGLAAAHERNVIHRDLKPANILLDGTGKIRITDFELAGASGEAVRAGRDAPSTSRSPDHGAARRGA